MNLNTDGPLLINNDYYKVYKQRFSAVDFAGMLSRYSSSDAVFCRYATDAGSDYQDNCLVDAVIDIDENFVNSDAKEGKITIDN